MKTRVIHARDLARHSDAIYIGREHAGRGRGPSFKRSRWANPWSVWDHGREKAVALFARWIAGDPEAAAMLPSGNWHRPTADEIRRELRGRVLACWCDPQPCHGHVLAAIADENTPGGEVPQGRIGEGQEMSR
jgi:hypothetical protein